MPTEQQMLEYQTRLNQIAVQIQIQSNTAAAKQTQILQKQERLENLKGG